MPVQANSGQWTHARPSSSSSSRPIQVEPHQSIHPIITEDDQQGRASEVPSILSEERQELDQEGAKRSYGKNGIILPHLEPALPSISPRSQRKNE